MPHPSTPLSLSNLLSNYFVRKSHLGYNTKRFKKIFLSKDIKYHVTLAILRKTRTTTRLRRSAPSSDSPSLLAQFIYRFSRPMFTYALEFVVPHDTIASTPPLPRSGPDNFGYTRTKPEDNPMVGKNIQRPQTKVHNQLSPPPLPNG